MKRKSLLTASIIAVLGWLSLSGALPAAEETLNGQQIIEKSQQAFYYAGHDMRARVVMNLIDKRDRKRNREMNMLRINSAEAGNQKFFIYFQKPGDVRRMTFMVWKYLGQEDDRWMFIPAVDLVKRIAANDKYSSFVGSDFTYEDISGRDIDSDTYQLLRSEKFKEWDCFVVERTPKESSLYTKRLSWVEKNTFLPVKEEFYDAQQELVKVFIAEKIESVTAGSEEIPSVTKGVMKNIKSGHRTEVAYETISYRLGLQEQDFNERNLRRPPREWTK